MATGCKNKIEKKTLRRIVAAGELLVLIIILVVIPLLFLATHPEFRSHFTSVEAFQSFLDRYQNQSILIYLLCQII